jgi:hypothetical protein
LLRLIHVILVSQQKITRDFPSASSTWTKLIIAYLQRGRRTWFIASRNLEVKKFFRLNLAVGFEAFVNCALANQVCHQRRPGKSIIMAPTLRSSN